MDVIQKDKRFSHVGHDPKFRSMPQKYKKAKVDKRFDAMFRDKRFTLKYTVDKRGRPVNFSSAEDLKRYYDAGEESDEEDEDAEDGNSEKEEETGAAVAPTHPGADDGEGESDEEDEANVGEDRASPSEDESVPSVFRPASGSKQQPGKKSETSTVASSATEISTKKLSDKKTKNKNPAVDEPEDEDAAPLSEPVRQRLMDLTVDYARGGGVLLEDSSSDDESEPEEVEVEHDWAELDKEAPRISDEETTARLAVCNMDWDRIKAQDIMVLMNSFLPPGGVIKEVVIYPSEFGKRRMADEEEHGPPELFDNKEKEDDGESSEEDDRKDDAETAEQSQMEYVRRYQLSRLRYYYAVVTCDSRQTVAKLYDECEGLEFESSASRVDLRFVPDDMTFDETPRESCSAMPEPGKYRPSQFVTTALQQKLVRFTWDETDADRQEAVRRAARAADGDDADIRAYLAVSSDDQQSDEANHSEREGDSQENEKERIAKYRALLVGADEQEEKKEDAVEMEITWGIGIKEKTEEIVKKKEEKDQTPWEKYIEKQKSKKKAKSSARKEVAPASSAEESDSDIPSDLAEDPFFKEELEARRKEQSKSTKKKRGKDKANDSHFEDENDEGQLALLTMDDEDGSRRHFNFKQIVKDETFSGKKKKWKKKRKPVEDSKVEDDFQVDVADPRFSKLYESAEFNVDPSDSRFKRTAGMERLVREKQRRVTVGETARPAQDESALKRARLEPSAVPVPDDLSQLVKTVKAKAKHIKSKKVKSR